MTVNFRGRQGRVLWDRIKDHRGLLEYASAIGSASGEELRQAEVAMVAFMLAAAFGYDSSSDKKYGSKLKRLDYLSRINPDIYRLSVTEEELMVEVECDHGTEVLNLGHTEGFSAVLPLTPRLRKSTSAWGNAAPFRAAMMKKT